MTTQERWVVGLAALWSLVAIVCLGVAVSLAVYVTRLDYRCGIPGTPEPVIPAPEETMGRVELV